MLARAFVGIRVPEALRPPIALIQSDLAARCPERSLRLVDPADLHMTLRYLGDLPEDLLPKLMDLLTSALFQDSIGTFTVDCGRVACFSNARSARVLYVGCRPSQELKRLAGAVRRSLVGLGQPDDKPFRAHTTVARVNDPRRDGAAVALAATSLPFPNLPSWTIDSLELMMSGSVGSKPRYTTVGAITV